MGSSVQFISKAATKKAYNDRDVEAWSISQGKQFMFKGMGCDELENVLEVLESGATNAVYCLKVYEDVEDKKLIKSNTPDDGSFNFRLNSDMQTVSQAQWAQLPDKLELQQRLQHLEELLEEREEPENSLGKLGEILNHPAIVPIVPLLVEKLMSYLMTPTPTPNAPAQISALKIAGVEDPELKNIVNELQQHDPELKKHLLKLLTMAKEQPAQFQQLIQIFN